VLRGGRQRGRAAVLFVVQRQGVEAFAAHDESYGRLREMLREVVEDGVEAYAYNCQVSPEEVVLDEKLGVMSGGNSRKGGLGRGACRDGVPAQTVTAAG
jgi:sugar fermentation stimulation protein A